MKSYSKKIKNLSRGLTMLELITVITIFAIMSGIVLFKYKDFDAGVSLTNTVQEIALRIQKAQSDSINGVQPRLASINQQLPPANWRHTYGVLFNVNHPQEFFYFMDRQHESPARTLTFGSSEIVNALDESAPWNVTCGNANTDECLDHVTITSGEKVVKICIDTCTTSFNTDVWVLFTRPFPDVQIYRKNAGTINHLTGTLKIYVTDKTNTRTRILSITPLGQISVSNSPTVILPPGVYTPYGGGLGGLTPIVPGGGLTPGGSLTP